MAKKAREIEFTIKKDGEVEVDQKGYQGKECSGDIQEILNKLGKEKKSIKKKEYHKVENVRINQGRS